MRSSDSVESDDFTEPFCSEGKVSFICCDKAQPLNTVNVLLLVFTNIQPSSIHHVLRNQPSATVHMYSTQV